MIDDVPIESDGCSFLRLINVLKIVYLSIARRSQLLRQPQGIRAQSIEGTYRVSCVYTFTGMSGRVL